MFPDDDPTPVIGFLVRFICGAAVGALLALGAGFLDWAPDLGWAIAAMVVFGILFGLMATFWGDDFWENLADLMWWW